MRKLLIVLMLTVGSAYGGIVEKSILEEPVNIPVPVGMNPICESDFSYWQFMRQSLPRNHHILTCMIDNDTVSNNLKKDAEITLLALIQTNLINRKISEAEFQEFKKGVLSYSENISEEKSSVNGKELIIKRNKPDFLFESDTELVLFESTAANMASEKEKIVNVYRAIVFLNQKPFELRIYSSGESSYTKKKLIKFGNQWKRQFLTINGGS